MTPHEQVASFNDKLLPGAGVYAVINGATLDTTTRAAAQVLSDGRAVVWVTGHAGAVPLEYVRPSGKAAIDLVTERPPPVVIKLKRRKRKRLLMPRADQDVATHCVRN